MSQKVYSIYKRTGSLTQDAYGSMSIFYLSENPKWLQKHLDTGEMIKPVSKSVLSRAWTLKDADGKSLRAKRGVVIATAGKAAAAALAKICTVPVSPVRYR